MLKRTFQQLLTSLRQPRRLMKNRRTRANGRPVEVLEDRCLLSGYSFVKIADMGGTQVGFSPPVINESGAVGFKALLSSGTHELLTGNENALTNVALPANTDVLFGPAINDSGTLAFGLRNTFDTAQRIMTSTGVTLVQTTSATMGQPGFFNHFHLGSNSINNSGTIALEASITGAGHNIYSGIGGLNLYGPGSANEPAINNQGFLAWQDLTGNIVTSGGATIVAALNSTADLSFSDTGFISYVKRFSGGVSHAVFRGTTGTPTAIATEVGPYSRFFGSSVNNLGDVAFYAQLDAGGGGVYTGPDDVADKVLATGDSLFGQTVTTVGHVSSDAINDAGQVAMVVTFGNGTTSLVRADPNTAPSITVGGTDSIAESLAETNAGISVSGTLSVEDVDITNTVAANVDSVVMTGDTNGITSATLLNMLTVDVIPVIDDTSTTGTINWSFDSGSQAFDHLGVGDSIVLEYVVTATDSQGGVDSETVTVTIEGTADAVAWDGGGTTSNWSQAANWTNDTRPATGDFVTIDLAGSPYTVILDVNIAAGQSTESLGSLMLNSADATLNASGKILTVNGDSDVLAGEVVWANSVWAGNGTLTVGTAGSVDMFDSTTAPSRIDSAIVNNGTFLIRGNTNEWTSSSIVNSSTGTLTIRSDANFFTVFGDNWLYLSDGMVNEGLIELRNIASSAGSATRLHTGTGTLVNEVGATIRTSGNTITTNHIMYAEIDNRGLIDFAATIGANVISGAGADSVNSGTITNSAETTVQIGGFNSFINTGTIDLSNSRFSQITGQSQLTSTMTNSGLIVLSDVVSSSSSIISKISTLDVLTNTATGDIVFDSGRGRLETFNSFNNSGDLSVVAGRALTVSNGTINNAAGSTLAGDGTITFVGTTIDVAGTLSTGNAAYVLDNAIVQGAGTFVNDSSVDMFDNDALPSRIDSAIVNNGTFLIRGNTNEWTSSSIVNSSTGTLTIRSDANFFTVFGDNWLYLSDGMVNEGLIELRNIASSAGSATRLHTGTGTLVNEVGATIRTSGNTITTNHIMYAEIDNRGLIDFAATIGANVISGAGADSVNSGTITNSAETTVQIGGFNSFINTGTIDLSNSRFSQITGQSQLTSTMTNSGLIVLSDVVSSSSSIISKISTLDVLTNTAAGDIVFDSGRGRLETFNSFNNSGDLSVVAGRALTVTSGTINSAAGSTLAGDGTITLVGTTMDVAGALSTGNAAYVLDNAIVQGVGTFVNDSSVDMFDNDALPSRIDSAIVNNGTFLIRGNTNEWTSSSIVNSSTGTLTIRSDANFFTVFGDNWLYLSDGMVNEGLIELRNMSSSAGTATRLHTGTGTLVNEVGATVRTVGNGITTNHILYAEIDNRGLIDFAATIGTSSLSGVGANSVNSGFIVASGASTVRITSFDSFENSGLIDTGGVQAYFGGGGTYTNLLTGQLLSSVEAEFNNVTDVFGVGTIGTTLNAVNSDINPGLSPGILNVVGNYLQGTGSGLSVEIGGNTAGDGATFHDQVNVTGTVSIGSNVTLDTSSFGGYVPVGGDSYVIINNDGTDPVSGTFTGLAEGAVISTDFLGSGESAILTYAGGTDNNDVVIYLVDTTAPNEPSTPDLDAGSDSGTSDSDDLTNVVLPTFSGTAEQGSTVELFSDVVGSLGITVADATTGAWSITSGTTLVEGVHDITATATDTALNVSQVSGALAVTVDTTAPALSIDRAAGQSDITDSSPVNFEVTFDETTSTFDSSDVTVSGNAGATTAVVTGSGTTYNVAVSGMTQGGSVIIDVAAGVATDTAGNLSIAATIVDNEVTFGDAIYDFDATTASVDETGGNFTSNVITVIRSGNTSIASSVDVVLTDGTATAGTDYTLGPVSLNFAAGETSKVVPIQILGDAVVELDETIALSLAGFSGAGQVGTAQSTATLIITNDDSATVSVSDVSQVETNSGQTAFVFDVTLSEAVDVSVDFLADTADDSATVADNDYAAVNGAALSFTSAVVPGLQTQTVTVLINGDATIEADEVFDLVLSGLSASGRDVTFVNGQSTEVGQGTIENDDSAIATISATGQFASESGTDGQFTVALSQMSDAAVDVSYSIGGTATNGTDYASLSGTVTVPANQLTATIDVEASDDLLLEGDESIIVTLTGATGGVSVGSANSDTVTITDDESVSVEFVSSISSLTETTAGHDVTLRLVGAAGISLAPGVTVTANVIDAATGSATSGADYLAFGVQSATFGPGSVVDDVRTVSLSVLGDGVVEPTEDTDLVIDVVTGFGASVGGQSTHEVTMLDSDTLTVEFSQPTGSDLESVGGDLPTLLVTGDIQIGHSVSIDVVVTGGTATVSDYTAPTTLSVVAGGYSNTVFAIPAFSMTDDSVVEPVESIELGNLTGSAITVGTQNTTTYTITDDDTLTVEFDQATGSDVETSGGNLPGLLVTGDVQAGHSVSVDVAVSGGTATSADFTAPTTLSITAGSYSSQVFVIPTIAIIDDAVVEPSETIELGNLTGSAITVGTQNTTTYTITDDDTLTVEFDQATGSDAETNGGNLPGLLVTGDVQAGHSVSVGVSVTGGTASATDLVSPTTLTVAAGSYSATSFTIPSLSIINDAIVEPTETIEFGNIAGPAVSVSGTNTTTFTILDDDFLTVEFDQASGSDVEASGGNLPTLLVTGDVQTGHSVSIDVAVSGGTATVSDYTDPTTLSVASGSYSNTGFAIPAFSITDDSVVEPNETIELGNVTGSAISVGNQITTTYTITDDDTLTVEFDQATGSDAEASGGNLPGLLVSGEVQAGHSVTVDVAVTNGTASTNDFVSPTTLTIASGSYSNTSLTLPSFAITDDVVTEADETIELGTISGSAVSVGTQSSTVYTILDDDTSQANDPPVITSAVTTATFTDKAVVGNAVLLAATFTDANATDTHTATIDWGDGTTSIGLVGQLTGSITGSHQYSSGGLFTVTVDVADNSGAIDSLMTTAVVTGIRVTDTGELQVIGTDAKDVIHLHKQGPRIRVRLQTPGGPPVRDWFRVSDVTSILIHSCDGNDQIHIDHRLQLDATIFAGNGHDNIYSGGGNDTIYGGAGWDHIHAGNGNDIVFGGLGNDYISGGRGNDLLFGGAGCDDLRGGRGDDILVGGDHNDVLRGDKGDDLLIGGNLDNDWESAFDRSLLDTALTEWATGDLADTMNILGNVVDDYDRDYLFGGHGNDTLFWGHKDRRWWC